MTPMLETISYNILSFIRYYDTNSWNFTKLGKVRNVLQNELKEILCSGNVELKNSYVKA